MNNFNFWKKQVTSEDMFQLITGDCEVKFLYCPAYDANCHGREVCGSDFCKFQFSRWAKEKHHEGGNNDVF